MSYKTDFICTFILVIFVTAFGLWFSTVVTQVANVKATQMMYDDYAILDSSIRDYQFKLKNGCPDMADLQEKEIIKRPEHRFNSLSQPVGNYSIREDKNHCLVSIPTPTKIEAIRELELSLLSFVPDFFYKEIEGCSELMKNFPLSGYCDSDGIFAFAIERYKAKS